METKTSPSKILVIANIAAYIGVMTVNVLSNVLPLNGRTAGDTSDALPSFFTPAGYTFAIWGLIYLALGGFMVYQALPSQRHQPAIQQIGWLFVLSSILNSVWLFTWHYGLYPLSVIFMVALLASLVVTYARLQNGQHHNERTVAQKLFFHFPFSIYMGWISVATIANIASVAAYYGWDGFGIAGQTWSGIMMMVAVAVVALLLNNRRDFAYAGVLIWALFGIRTAFIGIALIANTALFAAGLIITIAVIGAVRTQSIAQSSQTLISQEA